MRLSSPSWLYSAEAAAHAPGVPRSFEFAPPAAEVLQIRDAALIPEADLRRLWRHIACAFKTPLLTHLPRWLR